MIKRVFTMWFRMHPWVFPIIIGGSLKALEGSGAQCGEDDICHFTGRPYDKRKVPAERSDQI